MDDELMRKIPLINSHYAGHVPAALLVQARQHRWYLAADGNIYRSGDALPLAAFIAEMRRNRK